MFVTMCDTQVSVTVCQRKLGLTLIIEVNYHFSWKNSLRNTWHLKIFNYDKLNVSKVTQVKCR